MTPATLDFALSLWRYASENSSEATQRAFMAKVVALDIRTEQALVAALIDAVNEEAKQHV